jgi:hypothetical protein
MLLPRLAGFDDFLGVDLFGHLTHRKGDADADLRFAPG